MYKIASARDTLSCIIPEKWVVVLLYINAMAAHETPWLRREPGAGAPTIAFSPLKQTAQAKKSPPAWHRRAEHPKETLVL
jgi:hypothetical protein